MPRKIVRNSGPWSTFNAGVALSLSISCSGTGSIMSMSPETSAATRVASFLIGVKIASVMLLSILPPQ